MSEQCGPNIWIYLLQILPESWNVNKTQVNSGGPTCAFTHCRASIRDGMLINRK